MANDDPSALKAPFFGRVLLGLINGWTIFEGVVIAIVNLWAIILLACAGLLGYRVYRKRKLLKVQHI